jgi:hypothetical protein
MSRPESTSCPNGERGSALKRPIPRTCFGEDSLKVFLGEILPLREIGFYT